VGSVLYHPGLETIDNKGITYQYTKLSFSKDGLLTGKLTLNNPQTLSLVVPAGIGIRANNSVLSYKNGVVQPQESSLSGKLILPYNTYEDQVFAKAVLTDEAEPGDVVLKGFDRFISAEKNTILQDISSTELAVLNGSMAYLGYRIQSHGLTVLPTDTSLQDKYSSIPFNIAQWSGEGFIIETANMTPASIGDDSQSAIGVTPGKVSVDLDRKGFVNTPAPAETKEPFWLGVIIKEGKLFLPSDYVKTENNARMSFTLSSGELLYDLNGFAYQNITYNPSGKKAHFGHELGGFLDVTIFDCMIDLYGGKVNVEMNSKVGIPLFGYQKVDVKLYKSKDTGSWVCSVAESEKLKLPGTGIIQVKVTGGQLQKDGMHINGTMDVSFPDKLEFADMGFNELVIPADMELLTKEKNINNNYGNALFEKPFITNFHGFKMEVRAISISSTGQSLNLSQLDKVYSEGLSQTMKLRGLPLNSASVVPFYQNELTLRGSVQLSDNMAMNGSDSFDSIVISNINSKPVINYQSSKALLDFEFEEFVRVRGVVTPVPVPGDNGLVEYDTDTYNMILGAVKDLTDYYVDANVRIGYDRNNKRHYFAIGTY
jgi:hypothetical protein